MNQAPRVVLVVLSCLFAGPHTLVEHHRPTHEASAEPEAPSDWFYLQRASPDGSVNYGARSTALAHARALHERARGSAAAKGAPLVDWVALGPINIGGRVTDIVADPNNPDVVYVGSASGGVFKSSDRGASWTAVFDGAGSLSIGALAMDPGDPQVVWVGTGEANPGGGSVAYGGDGVWVTTDGGANWTHRGLTETRYIGRMVIDPSDPQRIYVAATGTLFSKSPDRGVYRTTDGGQDWERVLFVSDSTGAVDLAIDPADPSRVFAAMWERLRSPSNRHYGGPTSGLYFSSDGGATWTELTNGLPASDTNPGRIGVAVAPSDPSVAYAIYVDRYGIFTGFYRSPNGGVSWSKQSGIPPGNMGGHWFGRIWVNPLDANEVWADGVKLLRTTDGGGSWLQVGSTMHHDHHAQWFQPSDPSFIWKGNDGGVYYSTDEGVSWVHITNIPNIQFYTNEVHPSDPATVYGGTQDNGTWRTHGSLVWAEKLLGADGFYVNVEQTNADVIYLEYQYGSVVRSTTGGAPFANITPPALGRANWNTPIVLDRSSPGYPNTVIYLGANRVFRSTDSGDSWILVSPDLSDGDSGTNGAVYGTITTLAVAPSDSATIYAGTDDANVWVSTDRAMTWTRIDDTLPERWVTRVAVDPTDDAIGYATFSGFQVDDPVAHVFRTTDWGESWSDISGNLPDAPVNDIIVDPSDQSVLYVGTDVGVFYTETLGSTWWPVGTGLPPGVVVTDLDYLGGTTHTLYAATYGRSMYSCDRAAIIPTDVPGTGEEQQPSAPGLQLAQNVPNPVRSETRIAFTLSDAAMVRITVFDVSGRHIQTLAARDFAPGTHHTSWDARDSDGRLVPSGRYVYRLQAGRIVLSRKLIVSR